MEKYIWQEEIPTKSGIFKANKLPMKKKKIVKGNTTNRNQKSLFTI